MNPGPKITLEQLGPLGRQERIVQMNYSDTFSVRTGGSFTTQSFGVPVTFRGGGYYDSTATSPSHTRLDNDTLDKLALTAGLGFEIGAFRFDAAYASVFDVPRDVKQGALQVTSSPDAPAVNEGRYTGHTHIFSIGATVALDTIFGGAKLPDLRRGGEQVARR